MAIASKARTHSGLDPYTGTWDEAAVLHLLKRTMFGATVEDLQYFSGKTLNQAVDEILDVDYNPPSPPVNNYDAQMSDPNIVPGQPWVYDYNASLNNHRNSSFKRWWIGKMVGQDRTIREKMVLFWTNHFSTETNVFYWANFAYKQNAMIRANCLKNFKTLVHEISKDPAMLIYLNGYRNTKSAPDENYSRELQELFTLGKGPDSKYTESDVIEAAKVLTGWRINTTNGNVFFDPAQHDTSTKQFSEFYGNKTITGLSGTSGADELIELIDMILLQDEVAKYIARRIYRWFVYYDIDEATEANVIAPMAQIFRNNNYDIKPMMEALFKSEHFFDVANRGAIIKSPIDFLVGFIRMFDIANNNFQHPNNNSKNNIFPGASDYVEQYHMWYLIHYYASLHQQDIMDPPSVAGWPAYYQIPNFHELWINSDTLPNRNEVTDYLTIVGLGYQGFRLQVDTVRFAEKFSSVSDPGAFIDDVLMLMHTVEVSQDQKDYMKSVLLYGQSQDYYWTDDWNDYINDKSSSSKRDAVETRLKLLFKYLMNLAEYQLS
ncbi:DUF1800 domain-containing protein [bacterium]|nr:DUF1800 domain-containing protein [bacterium]